MTISSDSKSKLAIPAATVTAGDTSPTGDTKACAGGSKPRRLLCMKEVVDRVNLSRANIYRMLATMRETGTDDLFPIPVEVSKGRIGWHEAEIDAWIKSRPRVNPPNAAPPANRSRYSGNAPKL